jgi:hypothetical protein
MSGWRSSLTVRVPSDVVRNLALPLLVGWGGACFAQHSAPNCALTDLACVEESAERICLVRTPAMPKACVEWLRKFEKSPNPDVRAEVAAVYLQSVDFWRADVPESRFYDRAKKLIHGVLAEDPTNVGALMSLSTIAPTNDERVAALRRVVAVDPSPAHLEFLASALTDLAESAALYERGYEAAMQRGGGYYAWRFARLAVFEYYEAGLPDRAAQLRERFERDLGLDAKVAEIAQAEAVEPARLTDVLGELCAELVLRTLGAKHCLAGIDHVVVAADAASGNAKARLAQSASDAMFLAARTGDVLSGADASWRGRFESTLRRYSGPEAAQRMHEQLTEITVE